MRPISQGYKAQNEYTKPLSGSPYHRNSGIIYAVDNTGNKYAVGRIDFERFDEQNFQYVFFPEWSVIDALPASIFQGIPGLDMSLRLERYYRVNMTPYFISERTPSEGREDLWELLDEVGLDYYDRFEWLLRSNMRCGIDNLIVERAEASRCIVFEDISSLPSNLQPGDRVAIHGLQGIATTSYKLRQYLLHILRSGAQIWDETERRLYSEEECNALLCLLLTQERLEYGQRQNKREDGIHQAQKAGRYTGRKKLPIDLNLFRQVANDFQCRRISAEEAMRRAGISSRSTFFRRLKELNSDHCV